MSYEERIGALAGDARQLEKEYRSAVDKGQADAFEEAIIASHQRAPDNLLYAAWYHRLSYTAAQIREHAVNWGWAIPLAIINGLLLWWLSGEQFMISIARFDGTLRNAIPMVLLLIGPISAILMLAYLVAAGPKERRRTNAFRASGIALGLAAVSVYVLFVYPQIGTLPYQEQYISLVGMHLPLLSWAGVGLYLVAKHRDATNRHRFLLKSLEVVILGGLFLIAGWLLAIITIGLFDALDVRLPEMVMRLFAAGLGGLIPVLAAAILYDPSRPPAKQSFDEGLSKLVALLFRLMLPLTVLVLAVYLGFIPFNFGAPFDNRDVLIIYNGMLFAVVALMVGATPAKPKDLSPALAKWLRRGIITLSALAFVVSLYALAAIAYRTAIDRMTPNRLAFIGWNIINTGLLGLVLVLQRRTNVADWTLRLGRAYRVATVAYTVWALMALLVLPWLFGINRSKVEFLPTDVQEIVFEHPAPVLLKCAGSQHVYLLDGGEKRWIDSIKTFSDRGYDWSDVRFVDCDDLRAIPDGPSIPADAGPPPQP